MTNHPDQFARLVARLSQFDARQLEAVELAIDQIDGSRGPGRAEKAKGKNPKRCQAIALQGNQRLAARAAASFGGQRRFYRYIWETKLTYETSYLARLHYVHRNPVHHGLVPAANQYPWCSAGWFERTATLAQVRTIYSFKTDQIKIVDDFDPLGL